MKIFSNSVILNLLAISKQQDQFICSIPPFHNVSHKVKCCPFKDIFSNMPKRKDYDFEDSIVEMYKVSNGHFEQEYNISKMCFSCGYFLLMLKDFNINSVSTFTCEGIETENYKSDLNFLISMDDRCNSLIIYKTFSGEYFVFIKQDEKKEISGFKVFIDMLFEDFLIFGIQEFKIIRSLEIFDIWGELIKVRFDTLIIEKTSIIMSGVEEKIMI